MHKTEMQSAFSTITANFVAAKMAIKVCRLDRSRGGLA